jgi:glycosyltransferase involved in cell wall biosynthesis
MATSQSRLRAAVMRRIRDPRRIFRRPASGTEAVVVITMAIPGPIRRPIARPLASVLGSASRRSPRFASAAFLARWAAGQRDAAAAEAERLGTNPDIPGATRQRLAMLLSEVGRMKTAGRVVDSMPDETSAALEGFRAHVLLGRGQYRRAADLAGQAVASGNRRARRTLALAESRLRVLDPVWAPDLGAELSRLEGLHGEPRTRARILHIVSMSLPQRQVGYTLRGQQVGLAQAAAGLDPRFATRAGFPSAFGVLSSKPEDVVDGMHYHHLAPTFDRYLIEDELITVTARAAVPLLERLRPAALQPASSHIQAQIALALGKPAGIPVVYEVRGFLEETWASVPDQEESQALLSDRYVLNRAAETRAMVAADAVVTLSQTMRDAIVERGIPSEKVVIVPNAVDVDRFKPEPRDDALAAAVGIEPGDGVVGYISSLTPYEGIEYLVEAVANLRGTGRKIKLVLVGEGRESDAIRDRAKRLGLIDGTLIMPGKVPHAEVRRWYSLLDVFVVPRKGNRVARLVTPLKPYEAMALERAVVVSDLPALREMVIPGETGMAFRAEDAADLASTLAGLLDDPALRTRLGKRAREWVATERSWSRNGRIYRSLYERLGVV